MRARDRSATPQGEPVILREILHRGSAIGDYPAVTDVLERLRRGNS